MMLDIVIILSLVVLFCYLRAIKPWARVKDDYLDPKKYDKPLRPMLIREEVMLLTFILLTPCLIYSIEYLADWKTASSLKKYYFGLFMSLNFVQIVKLATCRPRPNAIAMERLAKEGNSPVWFKCDPTLEMRQSFFSGHSMLGSYMSFFIVFLLQDIFYPKDTLGPSAVQFLLILIGMFPATSQGISYWHHWDDVLVGYGVGVAAATTFYYGINP